MKISKSVNNLDNIENKTHSSLSNERDDDGKKYISTI